MRQYKKIANRVGLAFLLASIGWACSNNAEPSPEAEVKAVIDNIEVAIESRSKSKIFKHVSDEYQDYKDNDKQALQRFATIYMLRNQHIELITNISSVELIDESTVAVEASVLMAGKSNNGGTLLNQLSADNQRVSAVFKNEDGDWLLNSMSWEQQAKY